MKRSLLLVMLLAILQQAAIGAQDNPSRVQVVSTTNLQEDGRRAGRDGRVLLVLVSQESCGYCEQIKREVIKPMIRSGEYADRLVIRELLIDGGAESIDFNGESRENREIAFSRYRAGLTPTLLFLAPDGEELVPKMIGFQTPEMYYYYVEQAIELAYEKLRQRIAMNETDESPE